MASGLPGGLGEKTIWRLPVLSQATRSISVAKTYYVFVSIWGKKKPNSRGPYTFQPWGLWQCVVKEKEDVFNLWNTSQRNG